LIPCFFLFGNILPYVAEYYYIQPGVDLFYMPFTVFPLTMLGMLIGTHMGKWLLTQSALCDQVSLTLENH
jgi:hypothetical protein